jgi:cobalamin biosynthesis protein CobD/CbiB
MTKKNDKDNRRQKLQQIVELLKFVLTLDDEEIVKSTIESVVELLEEEIGK